MKSKKSRLVERIAEIDSEFINEQPPTVGQQASQDVENLQKQLKVSPAMRYANSRIDTPQEFELAFATWLASTGLFQKKMVVSVTQIQQLVANSMRKNLNYK